MAILPDDFFNSVDSEIGSPWIGLPVKAAAVAALLFITVELARWAAIYFWSSVTTRIEFRAWVDGPIRSAGKIGVDIRIPGWRNGIPRSVFLLPQKTPIRLFHYMRARRLVRLISSRRFKAMAARRNLVGRLAEIPMRVVRVLAKRPIVLGCAAFLVYDYERPGRLEGDLDRILSSIPQVAEQRTWIPVAVLVVGLVAASRSSPLVDRVRARDEAAKDANRMLTELLAKLRELQVAVTLCHETLPSCRQTYFDGLCDSYEMRRVWSPSFGFERAYPSLANSLNKGLDGPEFQRARIAMAAVNVQLNAIRDKGLSPVVLRMLSPVSVALRDCGLHWQLNFSWSRRDEEIPSVFDFDWMMRRGENVERQISRLDAYELPCRIDATLTEEAYRLDGFILRSVLNEFQIERICKFLQKRIHGTTLTRLLGGAGAK
ncbi:hypothetical protein [Streptomyces spectabilis]|uniref:Uncharacterized protein n=1 Tax=Streptomyces spectabilis TaxID=68270 RepID=A0A516RBU8_STRST|nr:hypothetical protein [Streptomyces spectabilis]QDQ13121.1 hypothetical protein FH965_23265 [Streptomyces spectabilis]